VRDVLRQIFETAGYTCRFSGDGYKGLEMFKAWRPLLVVTDIKHPGLSACELLREVRAVDDDVAVIVLTAASEAKTVVSLLKLGADAFLMKPMIVDELLIVSERALERRQLLSERRKRQDSP
jgi:DNA-binding NtrC family response regulator